MFWLLIAILVVSLIYLVILRPLQHWKRLGVTQDSVGNLLLATISGVLARKSVSKIFETIYKKFPEKRYTGSYQMYMPFILLKDPELIKRVIVKDFDFFTDRTSFVPNTSDDIWHKNLFSLKGNTWRDMRATLSPSFTSRKLKTIYPLMIESANQFVRYFEQQKEKNVITIEIKEVFAKFTNDIIATAAFGITVNSLENPSNEFYLMGKEATNFNGILKSLKMVVVIFMPRIASLLGFSFFDTKAVDFFQKIIKENIKSREDDGIVRSDMIQLLLQAKHDRADNDEADEVDKDEDGDMDEKPAQHGKIKKVKLTDEDIVAQAFLFFFAGFESVSSAMTFMAYELAINPDVQEKLYQEIHSNLETYGTPPTYENLLSLKYLDMVISETLRKYPGAPAIDRQCVRPYTIQPEAEGETAVHFKVGEAVVFATVGLHRDPKLFPNPERFDPERFSEENKSSIIPGSYMPFGFGPRACIASRFAQMEIKVLFYFLLSKFELVVVEKTPIPIRYSNSQVTMTIECGSCLGLKKRI